jgi:hypothetical protein
VAEPQEAMASLSCSGDLSTSTAHYQLTPYRLAVPSGSVQFQRDIIMLRS